jgi:hypothetical protein
MLASFTTIEEDFTVPFTTRVLGAEVTVERVGLTEDELGWTGRRLGQRPTIGGRRWRAPLPVFIEDLVSSRSGRAQPEVVVPVEERTDETSRARPTDAPHEPPAQRSIRPQRRPAT